MYRPNFKSVSSSVNEIIAIGVLGGGCEPPILGVVNPQSWGRGGRRGAGMVSFERALLTSYRPSMVTFSLSLRVSEMPLLCSITSLFTTLL